MLRNIRTLSRLHTSATILSTATALCSRPMEHHHCVWALWIEVCLTLGLGQSRRCRGNPCAIIVFWVVLYISTCSLRYVYLIGKNKTRSLLWTDSLRDVLARLLRGGILVLLCRQRTFWLDLPWDVPWIEKLFIRGTFVSEDTSWDGIWHPVFSLKLGTRETKPIITHCVVPYWCLDKLV